MSRKYHRREFLIYSSATLSTSLLLKACTNNSTSTQPTTAPTATDIIASPSNGGFKIAIVLAENLAGYQGVKTIQEKLGVETAYKVVQVAVQTEKEEALSDLARRGFNLIYTYAHGGLFNDAINNVAPQFPKTFFVCIDGVINGMNKASLHIDYLQASYICGIIGASMTKSNKIAYLAAHSLRATDEELRGLELGAKSVKPDINIVRSYTGDWNDATKAQEATQALISSGADVIYQWLDNASTAVLQTAAEKGVYAFGNMTEQLNVAPKAVLTSVVKRIDLAIAYLTALAIKGNLQGKIYTIGLENPEILYLGKFGVAVPKNVEQKASQMKDAILAKQIMFETCQDQGKSTRCVQKAP